MLQNKWYHLGLGVFWAFIGIINYITKRETTPNIWWVCGLFGLASCVFLGTAAYLYFKEKKVNHKH